MTQPYKQSKKRTITLAFIFLLVFLSTIPFYNRVMDCLQHPELQNTTDMDIFSGAAKQFLATNQLYQKGSNYSLLYAPGEGVYKFPPPYQLTLLPFLETGMNDFNFLLAQRLIQLILYAISSFALIITYNEIFIRQDKAKIEGIDLYKSCKFIGISLLLVMWSRGFFESLSGVEPEILVFSLLALTYFYSDTKPFLSGFLLAVAATAKVYPVFLVFFFFGSKWKSQWLGFITGIFTVILISILYIGVDENIFYLKNIMPVLLSEKPIIHIQNSTIETLFYMHNFISGMPGNISKFVKYLTLLIVISIGVFIKRETDQQKSVFFALLISGILLCLPNYWPQYQVLLIIPALCLFAYSINTKSNGLYISLIVIFISLGIQESWFQDLKQQIITFDQPADKEMLMHFVGRHPSSDPILYFFPVLWILFRLRDLVFLVPAIFFAVSSWVLCKNSIKSVTRLTVKNARR